TLERDQPHVEIRQLLANGFSKRRGGHPAILPFTGRARSGSRSGRMRREIPVGVLVVGVDTARRLMGHPPLRPSNGQPFPSLGRRRVAEVRQRLPLLLRDVLAVFLVGTTDRRPPLVATDVVGGRLAYGIPDLVVILDRVLGLVLRVVGVTM